MFPEFEQWRKFVKEGEIKLSDFLYDIDSHKVGVIRTNSKFSYPSDNSIIKVEKNLLGNRRLGKSIIIKDNLVFGIRESEEKFKQKVG